MPRGPQIPDLPEDLYETPPPPADERGRALPRGEMRPRPRPQSRTDLPPPNVPALLHALVFRPAEAIRYLIACAPEWRVNWLAGLYGVSQFIENIFDPDSGGWLPVWGWIAVAVTIGPALGVAIMHGYANLVTFTCRWFGGEADPGHVRTAFAWSLCPSLAFVPAAILMYILIGPEQLHIQRIFDTGAQTVIDVHLLNAALVFLAAQLIFTVWSLRIHIAMLTVVCGVGWYRAILTALCASLLMLLILLPVILVVSVIAAAGMVATGNLPEG